MGNPTQHSTATSPPYSPVSLTSSPLCGLAPPQGAIIISGVLGLVDYGEAYHLWRVSKFDWMVFMVALLGTMFLGVERGLGLAVAISLVIILYRLGRQIFHCKQ